MLSFFASLVWGPWLVGWLLLDLFKTGSSYVAQAGLEFFIPQLTLLSIVITTVYHSPPCLVCCISS